MWTPAVPERHGISPQTQAALAPLRKSFHMPFLLICHVVNVDSLSVNESLRFCSSVATDLIAVDIDRAVTNIGQSVILGYGRLLCLGGMVQAHKPKQH